MREGHCDYPETLLADAAISKWKRRVGGSYLLTERRLDLRKQQRVRKSGRKYLTPRRGGMGLIISRHRKKVGVGKHTYFSRRY